jgi:hypothetical protein
VPAKIEEMDRQALRRAGFKDRDIWDIAAVAAFYNMSNRLAAAADMKPNREYHFMVREMMREEDAPSAAGAAVRAAATNRIGEARQGGRRRGRAV